MDEFAPLMRALLVQPLTVEALAAELALPPDEADALVDAAFVAGLVLIVARHQGAVSAGERLVRLSKRAFAMHGHRPRCEAC